LINLIAYLITFSVNCAVYIASPTTETIIGLHVLLNVYVYCAVAVFVGVAQVYTGVCPYATCSVFKVFPSQSTQVIVYSLTFELN
jgi:hypothetical protein